jgi:hypothetical protein
MSVRLSEPMPVALRRRDVDGRSERTELMEM